MITNTPSRRGERTQVAIVGGGPAGLMLSHLLSCDGIDSTVIDVRTHGQILATHRAGILEHDSARLLVESGVSDRVLTDGREHEGIALRFNGISHRNDFKALVGASCWLYPQTEVFADLHMARTRDGGALWYGVSDTAVGGIEDRPWVEFVDAEGLDHRIDADLVVGADGAHGICKDLVVDGSRRFRRYPYAWFGVMVAAPPSAPELIYCRSDRGFALISQRSDQLQRMYFQCDPAENPDEWSDDRIWEELQSRVAGDDGFTLNEGPVVERTVLPFRSFVQTPMRHHGLMLAGDAAHTVPPTGAKGLNLALSDVRVLAEVIRRSVAGDLDALDSYSERALSRVWRAQHFSYWMTSMLHTAPDADDFDANRQLGELSTVVSSEAGSTYLAEGYTGWPSR